MPLYEYECDACHHRFERIQKFSDPPVDVWPNCGKGAVNNLLSSLPLQFKGSGWYITDYARKSSTESSGKTSSGSSSDTSSTPSTSTSSSSDTGSKSSDKPETKS